MLGAPSFKWVFIKKLLGNCFCFIYSFPTLVLLNRFENKEKNRDRISKSLELSQVSTAVVMG